jgi:transcription elongation factor GreB
MGRFKPPEKLSYIPSNKITPQGYERLAEELKQLWKIERPKVTRAVAEAAAEGDRSENAEYIYGKKRLREIDRRVRYLKKCLDTLQIVDTIPDNNEVVKFGAWVKLEDQEGDIVCYRIVGSDEFNLEQKLISVDSPVARALLDKKVGELVTVKLPQRVVEYEIIEVNYTQDPC